MLTWTILGILATLIAGYVINDLDGLHIAGLGILLLNIFAL